MSGPHVEALFSSPADCAVPLYNRFVPLDMDVSHEEEVRTSGVVGSPSAGKRRFVAETQVRLFPLVMHAANVKLAELPRTELVNAFRQLSGLSFTYKCMRGGDLLLFPSTSSVSDTLLLLTVFGKHVVTVKLPRSVSGCRGIIRNVPKDFTADGVLEILRASYKVRAVSFLKSAAADLSGASPPAWTVLVDFEGSVLPPHVVLDFQFYPVLPYRNFPLQCAKCCRFGHIARECRGTQRCLSCGGPHTSPACPAPRSVCPNCKGDHHGRSKVCPSFRAAAQAIDIMRKQGLSYRDALKKARPGSSPASPSFQFRSSEFPPLPSFSVPPSSSLGGFLSPIWEILRRLFSSLISSLTGWLSSFLSGGGFQKGLQDFLSSLLTPGPSV